MPAFRRANTVGRQESDRVRTRRTRIVGTSAPRKEGLDKVTGEATYVDDLVLPALMRWP